MARIREFYSIAGRLITANSTPLTQQHRFNIASSTTCKLWLFPLRLIVFLVAGESGNDSTVTWDTFASISFITALGFSTLSSARRFKAVHILATSKKAADELWGCLFTFLITALNLYEVWILALHLESCQTFKADLTDMHTMTSNNGWPVVSRWYWVGDDEMFPPGSIWCLEWDLDSVGVQCWALFCRY